MKTAMMPDLRSSGKNRRLPSALALCAVILYSGGVSTSCTLDYEPAELADEIREETPDSVLIDVIRVSLRKGEASTIVKADRIQSFGTKNENRIDNASFQELDADGNVITEGRADSVLFFTRTEDAELQGNIYLRSEDPAAEMETEFLYWNHKDKILTGKPEETMSALWKGSEITGYNFRAELRNRTFFFDQDVRGRYVSENE